MQKQGAEKEKINNQNGRVGMGLAKRRFLLSAYGCLACEMLKRQLAGKIKSGEVKVVNLSLDRNFHLVKELGIEFIPEIVIVVKNADGTFDITREDGRIYKLNKWRWWKKFKVGTRSR